MASTRLSGSAKRLTSGLVLRDSLKGKIATPVQACRAPSLRHRPVAPSTRFHQPARAPVLEGASFRGGQMQAMLGAPFQNVGGGLSPFILEQIIGFAHEKILAEAPPQIGERAGRAQQSACPCAVEPAIVLEQG